MKFSCFPLLWGILIGACGGPSHSNDQPLLPIELRPTEPLPVANTKLRFVSAQRQAVSVNGFGDPALEIKNRESCKNLLNFLREFEPKWVIDNFYAKVPAQQSSWKIQETGVDFYHVTYPTELEEVSFQVQFAGETKAVICVQPKRWQTNYYLDAQVRWPSLFENYQVDDLLNPGTIQEGSRGGFVFVKALLLGYQPRLSWALFPKEVDAEKVLKQIKLNNSWLEGETILLTFKDLIDRTSVAPGEVFSFSHGPVYRFDSILVKSSNPATTSVANQALGGFYDSTFYDFSLSNRAESILRNSKVGLENRVLLDSKTLTPLECDRSLSGTNPRSCVFRNKIEIFKNFESLFLPSSQAKTYVLTYYRLNPEVKDLGLVKVMAIDSKGTASLVYNKFHRYVTDALEELNGTVPPATEK